VEERYLKVDRDRDSFTGFALEPHLSLLDARSQITTSYISSQKNKDDSDMNDYVPLGTRRRKI